MPRSQQRDQRFLRLLDETLSRIPADIIPLTTVREVRLAKRGPLRGLVGLTTWGRAGRGGRERGAPKGRQTVAFYGELLDQLSDRAAMAVIAHELAHAWLNEHVLPEDSKARETETDDLVSSWGLGEELHALNEETETIWEAPESRRSIV